MKRYISASVIVLGTLGDWLEGNKEKINPTTKLKVYAYISKNYPFRRDGETYRQVFSGTFNELYYGYGARCNYFIPDEDYDYERDYFDNFWNYEITEVVSPEDDYYDPDYISLMVERIA